MRQSPQAQPLGTPAGRRDLGGGTSNTYYIPLDHFETSYLKSFYTSYKGKYVGESFDFIPTCLIPRDYPGQEGCVSTSPALWGAVCEALPAHAVPGH